MSNLNRQEIVKLYKEAKDKNTQIDILAQLTASDVETIIEILRDEKVFAGELKTCIRCGKKYPAINPKGKMCPACIKAGKERTLKKSQLKRNMTKIQELVEENRRLIQELI